MKRGSGMFAPALLALMLCFTSMTVSAQEAAVVPASIRELVDHAIARVKPALVRIQVVSTEYADGREMKYQSSGSGVIISPEGHVVTNHHVAGHATRLLCTLESKEEIQAEIVGVDPLSDIAVIRLMPNEPREFPVATFGDSDQLKVGDYVLAMGSPMSLSQSVTLGIVSNTELVMPEWMGSRGGLRQDGEDVGSLVRWIGHDAVIFGGNSGGPLVDLNGAIIGINEISMGLGGAIPGNLSREVAAELVAKGSVERAWLGITIQPRIEDSPGVRGALVGSVLPESPAARAGLEPGDLLVKLADHEVDIQFAEELPLFNQTAAKLPIGQAVELVIQRDGKEQKLQVTPEAREKAAPDEEELKQWGITARNLSNIMAKEMKRDTRDGILVTSTRPSGPAANAKPRIEPEDILIEVNGEPVKDLEALRKVTAALTEGKEEPVPAIVGFERDHERYITVVRVGVRELDDPGLEFKSAWLPLKTQVLTRDIAEQMGNPDLTGFRVTQLFPGGTAEKAGLQVGDLLLAVDGEPLTASAPENYDDLAQMIRQYQVGDEVSLELLRGGAPTTLRVELAREPSMPREMRRYRDKDFEITVRDIAFLDRMDRKLKEDQIGVLVEEVQSGGWADVGLLEAGDLLIAVEGTPITNVTELEGLMDRLREQRPEAVVFKVLRGIHTMFLEIEPNWDSLLQAGE